MDLFNLLKKTIQGHQEIRISSKEGEAVLLSGEDYDSLLETLQLLSTPGLKESVRARTGRSPPEKRSRWTMSSAEPGTKSVSRERPSRTSADCLRR
jgi:prevent-host-death family protein